MITFCPSSIRPLTFSNDFSSEASVNFAVICPCLLALNMYKIMYLLDVFSETVLAIFTRFHMESYVKRVFKICSNGSAAMAAMLIYGKNT